jgi:hypothetical protein
MYAQVVTPGYMVVLESAGKTYEFHTDLRSKVVLCLIDGEDAAKVLEQ